MSSTVIAIPDTNVNETSVSVGVGMVSKKRTKKSGIGNTSHMCLCCSSYTHKLENCQKYRSMSSLYKNIKTEDLESMTKIDLKCVYWWLKSKVDNRTIKTILGQSFPVQSKKFADWTKDDLVRVCGYLIENTAPSCVCCYDDLRTKARIELLCKHSLCTDCMVQMKVSQQRYYNEKCSCPICRAPIDFT
jgi:hypothetical protein